MTSNYVSLAIDHGTTNSCIAVMSSGGPRIISAEPGQAILPSAVFYDAAGRLRVGSDARRAMMTSKPNEGEGYTGYKLHIGTDRRYEFKAARKSLTAPEMGAVIIQTLLRAYNIESGIDAQSCVITVPAKFKQNAVEGTRTAAEMAGLKYYPLLMEPVAAAMRYGFTSGAERSQWMVFDLGGGTLDVSLLIVRGGKMVVPDGGHAGDDALGGSKFDQELANHVLNELEKEHKLGEFRNNRQQHSYDWGRLLLAVEEAKIALSAKPEAVVTLDEPLCQDDQGKDVRVEVPVSRALYEELIRPDAERAVQICKMLLKNNRLSARQVGKLILVGGPSKTPLIQRMLRDQLGIPLDSSVDPMTAVAEGAAIYADTVEIPPEFRRQKKVETGEYAIRIECDRHSAEPVYCAVGMVDGPSMKGLSVQIERLDQMWKSPLIPVDEAGVFTAELTLMQSGKPDLSQFRTRLFDASGRLLTTLEGPQIWHPYPVVDNRVANSLRVRIKGNRTSALIKQGSELPAEGSGEFFTTKVLRKGTKDDVLRVPILESITNLMGHEDEHPDCCLHVGTLQIHGSDERVTMDVPQGSEIQVIINVDHSRTIKGVASITLLNADFETTFTGETFEYDLADLRSRAESVRDAIAEIKSLHQDKPLPEVADMLDVFEKTQMTESIDNDFARAASGDRDAEMRGYKRLLEAEGTIHELQRMQDRTRIERAVATLDKVVQREERTMLDAIVRESERAKTPEDLTRILGSIDELEFAVRGRPWLDLRLDVIALAGERVNPHQHELFNKASGLFDKILEGGGINNASDTDIAEMVKTHGELLEAHSNLYELRQAKLDEMGLRGAADLRDSDIDTARR